MRDVLQGKSELELLSMLGLLVREYRFRLDTTNDFLIGFMHNYALLQSGHSPEWCRMIERLFWMLDSSGRGYATQDGRWVKLQVINSNTLF